VNRGVITNFIVWYTSPAWIGQARQVKVEVENAGIKVVYLQYCQLRHGLLWRAKRNNIATFFS